ncbi:MAG: hypothetical protein ACI4Q8_05960 [Ruminococcus sp.]
MEKVKRIKKLLYISLAFICIYSGTILFMPLASDLSNKTNKISVIVLGITFWLSLILAYTLLFLANRVRKTINFKKRGAGRVGLFNLFSNKPAIISDILLFLSIVVFVISLFLPMENHWIIYIILFFIVLSLNLHCVFNGKIYEFSKLKLE